jgi:hypothetical protein
MIGDIRVVCSSVATVIIKCPRGRLHVRLLVSLTHVHVLIIHVHLVRAHRHVSLLLIDLLGA